MVSMEETLAEASDLDVQVPGHTWNMGSPRRGRKMFRGTFLKRASLKTKGDSGGRFLVLSLGAKSQKPPDTKEKSICPNLAMRQTPSSGVGEIGSSQSLSPSTILANPLQAPPWELGMQRCTHVGDEGGPALGRLNTQA